MSRWIDAEWLIKESMPLSFSVQKWVNEVQIMTAPSIDICFCRECKYWCKGDEVYGICYRCPNTRQMRYDDFCSYGDKRDD